MCDREGGWSEIGLNVARGLFLKRKTYRVDPLSDEGFKKRCFLRECCGRTQCAYVELYKVNLIGDGKHLRIQAVYTILAATLDTKLALTALNAHL